MKKYGTIIFLAACIILVAAVAFYAGGRFRGISAMQKRVAELEQKQKEAESPENVAALAMLRKHFPEKADVSSFVESIYILGRRAGLENMDIVTQAVSKQKPVRKTSSPDAAPAFVLTAYPVKVTFEGDYRAVAQFVREIQKLERYKRIVQMEMKPLKSTVKTIMTIELMAYEVAHAA
ncbi:MAG: type 4a pilus biogenesis protein PilO [Nitrospirota bacterium]